MEETTVQKINALVQTLSVDVEKFYNGNNTAGTRARKTSQDLKSLLQQLRVEILEERSK